MPSPTTGNNAQGDTSSAGAAAQTGTEARLLPVFADLQQRMVAAVKGEAASELQGVHHAITSGGDQQHGASESEGTGGEQQQPSKQHQTAPGLTLAVSLQDVERACGTVLDSVVDAFFSDAQRTVVQTQSEETLRSVIAATRKARPDAAAIKEARHETAGLLNDMYDSLFNEDLRNQTRKKGEPVIQALLHGDVPAARRKGEQALLWLVEQRGAVLADHWQQVFRSLMKAVSADAGRDAAKAENSSSTETASSDDSDMPGTIARSDKRAQRMWKTAHARAVKEHGEGRRAERAAYESLKREYEKKGDRWVKKSEG